MRVPQDKPCMTVDMYTHGELQKMGGRKVRFAKEAQVKTEESEDDIWGEVTWSGMGYLNIVTYMWHALSGAPNLKSYMVSQQ